MLASARDVAAELRKRMPAVGTKKLHKLLYYCQGHHLATFDTALFTESIAAWDMGPVVSQLWHDEKIGPGKTAAPVPLYEGQLNTIGYVLSRYGALTGQDLENLTHSEAPWQRANATRQPGTSARIEQDWMREYFRTAGSAAQDDQDLPLDSDAVTRWLRDAPRRLADDLHRDTVEGIRSRLSGHA